MKPIDATDRALVDEIVDQAGVRMPDYADEAIAATAGVRQRPGWTFASRWLPEPVQARPGLAWALIAALLVLALVAGLLVGTGGSPLPRGDAASPAPSPPAASGMAIQGAYAACASASTAPVTLRVWDQEDGPGVDLAIKRLIVEFERANPGVTILRERKASDELAASVTEGLQAADGPDIVQLEGGLGGIGTAVRAGLLLPLSDASAQFGWSERWDPGILARSSFAEDGSTYGAGTVFGVPLTGDIVGQFYNYELALSRPARPYPESLDGLLEDLAAVQDAGMIPIVAGAQDDDLVRLFSAIAVAESSAAWAEDIAHGADGATFDTPEVLAAARAIAEIGRQGYLIEGWETLSHEEAVRLFASGTGQFLWADATVSRALTDATDELAFSEPAWSAADGSVASPGGTGLPWSIRRTSPNPGCAAAFLDYLTGDHAMQLLAGLRVLPSHYEGGVPNDDEAFSELVFGFTAASRAGRLAPDPAQSFPDGRAVLRASLASLAAQELTPEAFVSTLEDAYRAYLASIE